MSADHDRHAAGQAGRYAKRGEELRQHCRRDYPMRGIDQRARERQTGLSQPFTRRPVLRLE